MTSRTKRRAAAGLLITAAAAAVFLVFLLGSFRWLVLTNPDTGAEYARFPMRVGGSFSVTFIHSVNKYPLTDYYEIRSDGIYVTKTKYANFGAGVQTELEDGESLSYDASDGSMIVSGFNRRMDSLIYIVGTVSDHTLTIGGREKISLRGLCGRNAKVLFTSRRLIGG
jgi:hypothetical protein